MENLTTANVSMDVTLESFPLNDSVEVSGIVEFTFDRELEDSESLARKLLFLEFIIDTIAVDYGVEFDEVLAGTMIAHENKRDER